MFVDFMNFKLDSIAKGFGDLIDRTNSIENNTELKREIGRTMGKIITEYTEETRIHFYKKGIPVKDADMAVDTFERWRMGTVQTVEGKMDLSLATFSQKLNMNLLAVFEVLSMAIALIQGGVGSCHINGKV